MVTRAAAARPDAIRRHNLGLLLGEVHRDGPLTRAELTSRLNLSRSTIGALVADLRELAILDERVPNGGKRAGRPSHVVAPRSDGPYAIAVDIDIGRVTSAAVGVGGEVLARNEVASASRPEIVVGHVVDACRTLSGQVDEGAWPVGIGVSVPGTVNRRDGLIEFAPNLDWRHAAFGSMLGARTPRELAVGIGNDADLAVLAEHLRGHGRDCDDVIYLMGRVGVGAGIIVNGSPLHGHDGYAGEVGHNVVDPSGPLCHCGKRGCIETYVGEAALLDLAGCRAAPTVEAVAAVFTAAAAGDSAAAAAVRTVGESLGRAVAGLVNVLNPQRVILGGSFAGVYEFAPECVEHAVAANTMTRQRAGVQLCAPALGDDSSLLGAAELAFAGLLADPSGRR